MKNKGSSITFHCLLILLVGLGIALLIADVSFAAGSGFSQQRELRGRTPDGKLQPLPPTTGERVMDTLDGMNEWLGPVYSAGDSIKGTAGRYQSRETLKKLIKETHPENVHKIYRQLPDNIHAVAKPLETAGKFLDYGDSALAYEEAGVSLIYGDKTGAAQALANDALSGAAATGGAWAFGKGGAVVGGALGGPPGAVLGGGIGAVVGAVGGSYTYDKYGKPHVDSAADYVSRKSIESIEEAEKERRRQRADLTLLGKPLPKTTDYPMDYGGGVVMVPFEPVMPRDEAQKIHKQAEEVRARQAEERARNLPSEKIGNRISDLDRQWKATTDPEARKRIEYELSLLNKRLVKIKESADKKPSETVKEEKEKLEPDNDGDGVVDRLDNCPGTKAEDRKFVDASGCAPRQLDLDGDGVKDEADDCPGTKAEERASVNERGCAPSQLDSDHDGVKDNADICPGTDVKELFVDANGCAPIQLDSDGDGITDDKDRCAYTLLLAGEQVDASGCSESQLARLASGEKEPQGKEKSEKDKQYYETGRKVGEALGQALLGAAAAAAGARLPTQPTQPTKPAGKKTTASSKPSSTTKPGGTATKYPQGAFSGSWSEMRGTIRDASSGKSMSCNTITTGGTITLNIRADGSVEGEFYNYIQSYIYRIQGSVDSTGTLNARAYCFIFKESVCYKEISFCSVRGHLRTDGTRLTGSGTLTCGPSYGTTYCTATWGQ